MDAPRGRVDLLPGVGLARIDRWPRVESERRRAGDVATNRQAAYRYNLLERFECGLVLTGTEVKSLREGKAQLKDAYAVVRDGRGVADRHVHRRRTARPRARTTIPSARASCCCTAREIERLIGRTRERGLTLVPTRVYFRDARAKVEIALARGKDVYDKRETIRRREMAREVQRELREARR